MPSDPTVLEPLEPRDVRARRRPGAIVFAWLWHAAWGLLLAWPAGRVVAAAYGAHPEGDGVLWRAGALELADLVTSAKRTGIALGAHLTPLVPVGIVLGLFPLAVLLASMAFERPGGRAPTPRSLWPKVAAALTPLGLLLALGALAMGVTIAVAIGAGSVAASALTPSWGVTRAEPAGVAVAALLALVPLAIGVTHDLARAAVVRDGASLPAALRTAWRALKRAPLAATWAYAWRGVAGWALVLGGGAVASALGGRAGWALVVLAIAHQAVIFGRVALRASWLARALRHVAAVSPLTLPSSPEPLESESDTPARSDAPAAPIPDPDA